MSGRDPFFRALTLLALLQLGYLAAHLVYPDLNLDYPFVDGDSYDWIANGLRIAGHDVRFSGRAPLLPLVIALLERAGILSWLPVLFQILFHGTVLAFYTLAARLSSRPAAFAVALALMINHSLLGISLQVMADVAASCLLFLAARSFLLGRYAAAGLAGGLSAITQPIGLLLAVPAALTLVLRRRDDLRKRSLWLGAGLLAGFPVLARLFIGETLVHHWSLLAPHSSIPFYAWGILSFLGLPACLLLAAGLGILRGGDAPLFVTALFAVLLGFFVFLYTYEAERFLVYPVWMAGLLIAWTLARLPRMPFAVAAVLLVAVSALPLPTWHQRVRAERRSWSPEARLDPELFRRDRSAVYLHEGPSDRYRTITQVGNALRKRVKYVPRSWMEPWNLESEAVGRIGEDLVYRVRLPGMAESWLLVTQEPLTPGPSPIPSLPPGEGRPEEILEHLRGWDGYVALIPGDGPQPWQLYLPFLVETTELYVPEPGQEGEILRIFAAAPNLGERRIGPVTVRRAEVLGRKASLVRGTAAPPR